MWFDVEAVGLDFTRSAPFKFENSARLDAPPDRVFRIWAEAEAQAEWFKDFKACRWASPARGVGAERVVELKAVSVRERFLAWEEGRRLSFCLYGMTLPLVTAMVEDMTFEPAGDGSTLFTWRAHYQPSLLMRAVHPIARSVFGAMFKESTEGLARYVKSHRT